MERRHQRFVFLIFTACTAFAEESNKSYRHPFIEPKPSFA